MNWLNYHHLFYFKTIATEGSIAKAAVKLRLGQPTLSTQLKQLEEGLGKELFERRNRALILTDSGKLALQYANEIFKLGDEMIEALEDRLPSNRVHIQIGALESIPKYLVAELAKEACAGPSASVSILEGTRDELLRELSSHRIDLLLANSAPSGSEATGLFSRTVLRLPQSLWAAPALASKLRERFPASLDGAPVILPSGTSKLRHDLEHYFKVHSVRPLVLAETQDTAVQKILASHGLGVVCLPTEATRTALIEGLQLERVGMLEHVYEEIFLISAQRKVDNPIAVRLMNEFLSEKASA
jgi:LysR family transcriptional activator of nhaA